MRARRDGRRVAELLERLARDAQDPTGNLLPLSIELVRARASVGEIVARLRQI